MNARAELQQLNAVFAVRQPIGIVYAPGDVARLCIRGVCPVHPLDFSPPDEASKPWVKMVAMDRRFPKHPEGTVVVIEKATGMTLPEDRGRGIVFVKSRRLLDSEVGPELFQAGGPLAARDTFRLQPRFNVLDVKDNRLRGRIGYRLKYRKGPRFQLEGFQFDGSWREEFDLTVSRVGIPSSPTKETVLLRKHESFYTPTASTGLGIYLEPLRKAQAGAPESPKYAGALVFCEDQGLAGKVLALLG